MSAGSFDDRITDQRGRYHGRRGMRGRRYRPVLLHLHLRELDLPERDIARFLAAYPLGMIPTAESIYAARLAGINIHAIVKWCDPKGLVISHDQLERDAAGELVLSYELFAIAIRCWLRNREQVQLCKT